MDGVARAKQGLSLGLSILLIVTLGPGDVTSMAYQSTAPSYPGQGAPATVDELQSVVAPMKFLRSWVPDRRISSPLAMPRKTELL